MKRKLSYLLFSALACGILVAATTKSADSRQPVKEITSNVPGSSTSLVQSKDVVDIAIGSPDHTTLVAAVKAAGLVETLKGTGPFTVFAPTNAAFAALPAGTVDGLLKPAKKADLSKILTYHVVPGAVKAADLKNGQKIKTVQGGELTVSIKDGKVMINGANVTAADLEGSNGVVHVIDAVLMPKK